MSHIFDKLIQGVENELYTHYRNQGKLVVSTRKVEFYIGGLVKRVVDHYCRHIHDYAQKLFRINMIALEVVSRLTVVNVMIRHGSIGLDCNAIYELQASLNDWRSFNAVGTRKRFYNQLSAAVSAMVSAGDVPYDNQYALVEITVTADWLTVTFQRMTDGSDDFELENNPYY